MDAKEKAINRIDNSDSISIPISSLSWMMYQRRVDQACGMYAMLLRVLENYQHEANANDYWAYLMEFIEDSINERKEKEWHAPVDNKEDELAE